MRIKTLKMIGMTNDVEPLLAVDEPAIHREKDRPRVSTNRRQRTFDNSSQREPSDFERVNAAIARARGRGRGRGGDEGTSRGGASQPTASPVLVSRGQGR